MRFVSFVAGVPLILAGLLTAARPAQDETIWVSFKVKKLEDSKASDALRKAMAALDGVDSAEVALEARSVKIKLKEKSQLSLSKIREALKKVSTEAEESEIVLTGKVRVSTSIKGNASKVVDALKQMENVDAVEAVRGSDGQFDLTVKSKGVTLGEVSFTLNRLVEKKGSGDEDAARPLALRDVTWISPEAKPRKKGS